jgi:hypothetical protein
VVNQRVLLRDRLVETAQELVHDTPAHPAGSVLRCFARAVRMQRLQGCDDQELADRARQTAERLLVERSGERPLRGVIPPQRRRSVA